MSARKSTPKAEPKPWLKSHQAKAIGRDVRAWWYEDLAGVYLYAEYIGRGGEMETMRIQIPWRVLLRAAERCGR